MTRDALRLILRETESAQLSDQWRVHLVGGESLGPYATIDLSESGDILVAEGASIATLYAAVEHVAAVEYFEGGRIGAA